MDEQLRQHPLELPGLEGEIAPQPTDLFEKIGIDLGLGSGTSTVWTCDLTHEYIRINADYRS